MKRILTLTLLVSSIMTVYAQNTLPVNSNLLIENGISPKVLDAALSNTLQQGAFKQNVQIKHQEGNSLKRSSFQFIYDPKYKDGIDIRIAYDQDSIGYLESKKLLVLMQEMHSFSRLSKSYLYDESSLAIISYTADEVILSFSYDKRKLEPELSFGKKVSGKIFIKNNELVKVELTNNKPIKFLGRKVQTGEFTSTTFFERTAGNGGHIVSSYLQVFDYKRKGEKVHITIEGETFEYKDVNGIEVKWAGMPENASNENLEVLDGSLGWALPLLGKNAHKLGYKLPRPIGVNIFNHQQLQVLEFTDLNVGVNGSEQVSLNSLFDLENSTVDQFSRITMVKTDVWILPFLNIMGVFGQGVNTIDGSLFLDEDLKDALLNLGWLIGLKPDDIPDYIPIKSDLTALTYGGGITLAGGVGNFNLSLNYQIVASSVLEANTTKLAHVFSPSIGYMTPFGLNIMVGAQGQYYNTNTVGFINLPDNNRLDYQVNFKPIRWNAILGFYVPISNHFELAIQSGWGARRSMTAVFGYRF